jgi:hypothetical protein
MHQEEVVNDLFPAYGGEIPIVNHVQTSCSPRLRTASRGIKSRRAGSPGGRIIVRPNAMIELRCLLPGRMRALAMWGVGVRNSTTSKLRNRELESGYTPGKRYTRPLLGAPSRRCLRYNSRDPVQCPIDFDPRALKLLKQSTKEL